MKEEGRLLAIPSGVDDFREIREGGYYFVDKSELVSDIVNDKSKVFLFTRPRRFGKSLNLSMIDAFFNLEYKGNGWFDGLKVNSHPEVEEHRNAYPVIRLCMKGLVADDVGIEREAGNGRADIIMRRNDPRYPNIVVELKKSRSKTDIFNTMEKEARKALTQIKTKEYYLGMKGKTYLYGVCFQNKKAKVLFEEMDL